MAGLSAMADKCKIMTTHNNIEQPFYIALDMQQNVFHYGKIQQGQQVSTKHTFESYETMKQWLNRLVELTVYPTEDELQGLEDDEIENV